MCICDLILLYYLHAQVGAAYERSGRDSTVFRILFVICWIVADLLGIAAAAISRDPGVGLVIGGFCLVVVCVVFFVIAYAVPPARPSGQLGSMDDYTAYL